jgi:hypothetical protein
MRLGIVFPRWKSWQGLSVPLITLVFWGLAAPAAGFNTNTEINIGAPLAATASLSITPSSLTFPNADPDTVPSIPAIGNPVTVTANAQTTGNNTVTLSVLAKGDLISGSSTIPIGNVTWTATGNGFLAGTMSKTTAQTAGSWTRSGNRTGTFSYFLKNSWSYATGNYAQTVTYTLTSP